jgi:hypothetical protein
MASTYLFFYSLCKNKPEVGFQPGDEKKKKKVEKKVPPPVSVPEEDKDSVREIQAGHDGNNNNNNNNFSTNAAFDVSQNTVEQPETLHDSPNTTTETTIIPEDLPRRSNIPEFTPEELAILDAAQAEAEREWRAQIAEMKAREREEAIKKREEELKNKYALYRAYKDLEAKWKNARREVPWTEVTEGIEKTWTRPMWKVEIKAWDKMEKEIAAQYGAPSKTKKFRMATKKVFVSILKSENQSNEILNIDIPSNTITQTNPTYATTSSSSSSNSSQSDNHDSAVEIDSQRSRSLMRSIKRYFEQTQKSIGLGRSRREIVV